MTSLFLNISLFFVVCNFDTMNLNLLLITFSCLLFPYEKIHGEILKKNMKMLLKVINNLDTLAPV